MLIVNRVFPIPSPDREAIFCKKIDDALSHSRTNVGAVQVTLAGFGTDLQRAVFLLQERILDRVQIDRQTIGMD